MFVRAITSGLPATRNSGTFDGNRASLKRFAFPGWTTTSASAR